MPSWKLLMTLRRKNFKTKVMDSSTLRNQLMERPRMKVSTTEKITKQINLFLNSNKWTAKTLMVLQTRNLTPKS